MALSTYTDLLAFLATFSIRSDQTANWPDFVRMAESTMERELRARQMTLRADGTVDEEFEDLPSDFAEMVAFKLMTSPPKTLQYLSQDQMNRFSQVRSITGGDPRYYTIVGPQFRFYPIPVEAVPVELTYYQRIPPLSENDQNWILYRHPDAYVYGALIPYGEMTEDSRLGVWQQKFALALDGIKRADHALGETLISVPTYSF